MRQKNYVPDVDEYIGLFVDHEISGLMLERAEDMGKHDPERSQNPASDLEAYIIQLVSNDIGVQL